ncbi:allantoin racemase [Saccharopolyspora erythraea NRRL 2338]|uniref:Hydantoin racemase n=2 Tax=Saccharopolyspora erythraea TaxID=1836 RepID=A4FF38_SACEN|nr:aspartate/glutamate racemase family protein [Saccharopolyspora erythraea]EQD82488.1 Asp/Glu/hydantoin racemase [Saccharopolyspora erythraea D]PFG96388.1 allantoin racemase [Saccharopolyspora erythraea NRRL 2338]QRK92893.1 Asp/Glu/hydantoin racemase [Saccharopolyspora erythraea]CAM02663.1 Asp/Glu racemase [Saccharopolyspora erythraea NRRL 2338]
MRIVIANVNTTEAVTEAVRQQAMKAAGPGTEVVAVTPSFGPESVEGSFESYLAAVAVMDRVAAVREPFDAVVLAGFGEHGKEGLAELFGVPVVDITEAAAHVAGLLGRNYAVVTSLRRTLGQIEDRLRVAGLAERCVSLRATDLPVLELEADPDLAARRIAEQAVQAVDVDRADVICLGCAGMAGLAEHVEEATSVPVVDGVTAAVGLAETLVRLGLRSSPSAYPAPRRKTITGWPVTGSRA